MKYILRVAAAIIVSGLLVAVLVELLPYELATALGLTIGAVLGAYAVSG